MFELPRHERGHQGSEVSVNRPHCITIVLPSCVRQRRVDENVVFVQRTNTKFSHDQEDKRKDVQARYCRREVLLCKDQSRY